jgi:hypothetical protein
VSLDWAKAAPVAKSKEPNTMKLHFRYFIGGKAQSGALIQIYLQQPKESIKKALAFPQAISPLIMMALMRRTLKDKNGMKIEPKRAKALWHPYVNCRIVGVASDL